jgi:hypothetical protein
MIIEFRPGRPPESAGVRVRLHCESAGTRRLGEPPRLQFPSQWFTGKLKSKVEVTVTASGPGKLRRVGFESEVTVRVQVQNDHGH